MAMDSRVGSAVSTGRLEAFSDGVFAIATTLLVLEIKVPHADHGDLFRSLLNLWPSYAAYVVSFATIGIMWVNHHLLIGLFSGVDRGLLFLNLGLLLVISFIPFPTGVIAEYLLDGTRQELFAAVTLYGAAMLILSLMFLLLWRHVLNKSATIKNPESSTLVAKRAIVFCLIAIAAYIVSIGIGAFAPQVALGLFILVAVLFAVGRLAR
jgi:uncharacterized membrane protein